MQRFDVSISCSTYHTNEQTVGWPVIWYFMEFILGHNNVRNYVWNYPCLPAIQNILSNRHSNIFISHMSKLIRGILFSDVYVGYYENSLRNMMVYFI